MTDALSIWTIYDRPTDWPHGFIARRHVVLGGQHGPTGDTITATDLELVRDQMVGRGLTNIGRQPDDQPHIVESWI